MSYALSWYIMYHITRIAVKEILDLEGDLPPLSTEPSPAHSDLNHPVPGVLAEFFPKSTTPSTPCHHLRTGLDCRAIMTTRSPNTGLLPLQGKRLGSCLKMYCIFQSLCRLSDGKLGPFGSNNRFMIQEPPSRAITRGSPTARELGDFALHLRV